MPKMTGNFILDFILKLMSLNLIDSADFLNSKIETIRRFYSIPECSFVFIIFGTNFMPFAQKSAHF